MREPVDQSGRNWAAAVAQAAKSAREDAGLTRAELAIRMRGSRDQVGRVESPAFLSRLDVIADYAHALDMSLWELVEEAERSLTR